MTIKLLDEYNFKVLLNQYEYKVIQGIAIAKHMDFNVAIKSIIERGVIELASDPVCDMVNNKQNLIDDVNSVIDLFNTKSLQIERVTDLQEAQFTIKVIFDALCEASRIVTKSNQTGV